MRLLYTNAAREDVDQLLALTFQQWPQRLGRTTSRLRQFERTVMSFPKSGQRTHFPGIRAYSLKPLPYVAFYRVVAGEIEVVRLYHASQRPFDPKMR